MVLEATAPHPLPHLCPLHHAPPHVSWLLRASQFQLRRSDSPPPESQRVSSCVAPAKSSSSSSFGQSCEAGPWESPAPPWPWAPPCQLLHPSDGPPPATSRDPSRLSSRLYQSARQLKGDPFSFVIHPRRGEKREREGRRGERKGRERAKPWLAVQLGSSREPLAKLLGIRTHMVCLERLLQGPKWDYVADCKFPWTGPIPAKGFGGWVSGWGAIEEVFMSFGSV